MSTIDTTLGQGWQGVATEDAAALRREIEGLRRRLLTQPTIEQAKGVLVGLYGIDADTAFTVLVRWSQHTNTRLHLLTAALVSAASTPSEDPHASLRAFINQMPGPSLDTAETAP